MKTWLRTAFFFILPFLSFTAAADSLNVKFVNLNVKNGLSSSTVNTIIKDDIGLMWFGTDDGLNKYDGNNITVYRHDPNDKNTIGKGAIRSMINDHHGRFWVGAGENLSQFDPEYGRFINVDFRNKGSIRTLAADRNGQIWVGTYTGLFLYNTETKKIQKLPSNASDEQMLSSDLIISILVDSKNRTWVGTNKGLHLYNQDTRKFRRISTRKKESINTEVVIRALVEDKEGNIWVGTSEEGISKLNSQTLQVESVYKKGQHSIKSNSVFALAINDKNELWIGTEEGLDILTVSTGKVSRIEASQNSNYNLVGNSIRSIYIDNRGIYWVGTYHGGVNKYDKNLALFDLRQSNIYDKRSLSGGVVTAFAETPDGLIYIGTDGGGLNIFNPSNGQITQSSVKKPEIESINHLVYEGGKLFIATNYFGVQILDLRSGRLSELALDASHKNGLSINVFLKDSRENLWIGSNGNGLFKYNLKSGLIAHYHKEGSGKFYLKMNGYITCLEEDLSGQIWIGSNDTGLGILDPKSEQPARIFNTTNTVIKTDRITDIYCDKDGSVWVGTYGDGLFLHDKNSKEYIQYNAEQNLANGVIHEIISDDSGNLWVSTNSGVSSLNLQRRNFKNYYSQNGLQANVFSPQSGLKSKDGTLYFGGLEGFNFFKPQNLNQNRNIPPLIFTDLKISNQSVSALSSFVIDKHITFADEINLKYGQNFSLSYSTLNFTSPSENRYAYLLDGFEKEWNHVGKSTTAVYTNLDPGTYTFLLKAYSEDMLWQTETERITIHVHPPFYRTTFAYVLYGILIFLVLFLIKRNGEKRLQEQFEREQQVRDAEQKAELDKLRIKFFTNISHELKTPLTLILSPLEKVLQKEKDTGKAELLSMISRNANRLNNLVSQLLDFKNIEEKETKLNTTENDLVEVARNIFDNLTKSYLQKSLKYEFTTDIEKFWSFFDKEKIERIITNVLSNAMKFTLEGGTISLRISRGEEKGINLEITDTGVGINESELESIFDRFYHQDSDGELNQGNGIGLSIVKEFVQLHKGTISVKSVKGEGSTFLICLPLNEIENPPFVESTSPKLIEKQEVAEVILTDNHSQKPTILLVEDNHELRNYLYSGLKHKYKVLTAENGVAGWNKILSSHPEVVVTDIHMPEMDGFTLLSKIKNDSRTKHLPVLILTVLNSKKSHELALKTGASDYLIKPFNEKILDIKIENLITQNRLMKETYSKQVTIAAPEVEFVSEDERFIANVIRFIEENLNNTNLSVDTLARHMNVSRGTLYTKTFKIAGETPVELIKTIKLKKASVFLEKSDLKIAQICYECGFSNPNYFSRTFRAKYDISPSDYIAIKRGQSS